MPKPHEDKVGCATRWGTNVLFHRPVHASGIGLVTAEWAFLERELSLMFSTLMGTQLINEHGAFQYSGNGLAEIALGQIYGIPPRLRLIRAALVTKLNDEEQEALKAALEAVKTSGERRNDVAHGCWAIDDCHPDEIILLSRKGWLLYSMEDFQDIIVEINRATQLIGRLMRAWLERREAEMRADLAHGSN